MQSYVFQWGFQCMFYWSVMYRQSPLYIIIHSNEYLTACWRSTRLNKYSGWLDQLLVGWIKVLILQHSLVWLLGFGANHSLLFIVQNWQHHFRPDIYNILTPCTSLKLTTINVLENIAYSFLLKIFNVNKIENSTF